MITIVPTILVPTKDEFEKRLHRLLPVTDHIQVDVMDGKFVPSTSIALHEIPDLRHFRRKVFEADLMVENPGAYIQPLSHRGFASVMFHVEVVDERSLPALVRQCHKYGLIPMLAINPETPVDNLLPYLDKVEGVMFRGVHPGFNGAPYVETTPARIAEFLRKAHRKVLVQVDGGMTPATIGGVVRAGATRINSGSYVSNHPDPAQAIRELEAAAEKALSTKGIKSSGITKKSSKGSHERASKITKSKTTLMRKSTTNNSVKSSMKRRTAMQKKKTKR